MTQAIFDAIRLVHSAGIGPVTYRYLVARADDEPSDIEGLLGPSPVAVDEIIRLPGANSGAVQMALLEFDLAGRVDRHAGNRVSLKAA